MNQVDLDFAFYEARQKQKREVDETIKELTARSTYLEAENTRLQNEVLRLETKLKGTLEP